MPFGLRPPSAPQLPEGEAPDSVAMGGIPPAFLQALAGLQAPTPEPVPQVTLPGMILGSLAAGFGSALAGRPEEAGPIAAEPLVRRRGAQERNRAREEEFQGQRSALLRQGAVAGETTRRAEETAGMRAEAAAALETQRQEGRMQVEGERTQRQQEIANMRSETQMAIAEANNRIRELQVRVDEGKLAVSRERAEADKILKDAQGKLAQARTKEIEGRAAKLTGEDLKEIRQFSRDIVGQAVSVLRSTPEGEEPTLTLEFSSGPQTFEGADEIKDGVLAYMDAAMRGSKDHDKLLGEFQRAFAEALGETRGGSLREGIGDAPQP